MKEAEVLDILKRTGALMEGHFKLSSGRHSDTYVQKQMVFQHPRLTASLGEAIAQRFEAAGETFDTVLSPALGAILFGNAVAYAANGRFIYAERVDGAMTLRRAQSLDPGERVLVVEDVVTTGGSAAEVVELVAEARATLVGVACLVDRTSARLPFRLHSLVRIEATDWDPKDCPLCAAGDPLTSPGSRFIASGGA
ncbi:MAG TPA: orotate phosphoribosyltransferase [Actinomycetota bacterium]|nr:orotate phosphoribosyltransferase [Actinomycetota bacterium]